eukprot:TRINITY_DN5538_c0_g1_i2.p1 TRINITY_DN5538_c0_g1~~TRINITY_DN5538_c0_g1_i2.p1  ORF type:complete len:182 (-),score=21.69 TRINITY_DN5538_c0_g1_i2:146-691(-)
MKDRDTMLQIKQLIVMGGAFECYGNVTLSAEFNIYVDPDAVHVCLTSGIPILFVPLDVTMQVILDPACIAPCALKQDAYIAKFCQDIIGSLIEFKMRVGGRSDIHMHDPLALALSFRPDIALEKKHTYVQVECSGSVTVGQTVAELRPGRVERLPYKNAWVCTKVDPDTMLHLFKKRVLEG